MTRDIATLKSAFVTYVRPLLEYNSVVWSPQCISDIRALEKAQNDADDTETYLLAHYQLF